jgi:hypothetical protein
MLLVVFLNKVQQGENQQWQRPLWNKPRYLNPRSLHRAASHPTGLGHSSSVEKGPFHIKGEYSYNHRADSIAQPRILRRNSAIFQKENTFFQSLVHSSLDGNKCNGDSREHLAI